MIQPAATSVSSSLALATGAPAAQGDDAAVSGSFAALLTSTLATGSDGPADPSATPGQATVLQLRQADNGSGKTTGKTLPLGLPDATLAGAADPAITECDLTGNIAPAATPAAGEIVLPGLVLPGLVLPGLVVPALAKLIQTPEAAAAPAAGLPGQDASAQQATAAQLAHLPRTLGKAPVTAKPAKAPPAGTDKAAPAETKPQDAPDDAALLPESPPLDTGIAASVVVAVPIPVQIQVQVPTAVLAASQASAPAPVPGGAALRQPIATAQPVLTATATSTIALGNALTQQPSDLTPAAAAPPASPLATLSPAMLAPQRAAATGTPTAPNQAPMQPSSPAAVPGATTPAPEHTAAQATGPTSVPLPTGAADIAAKPAPTPRMQPVGATPVRAMIQAVPAEAAQSALAARVQQQDVAQAPAPAGAPQPAVALGLQPDAGTLQPSSPPAQQTAPNQPLATIAAQLPDAPAAPPGVIGGAPPPGVPVALPAQFPAASTLPRAQVVGGDADSPAPDIVGPQPKRTSAGSADPVAVSRAQEVDSAQAAAPAVPKQAADATAAQPQAPLATAPQPTMAVADGQSFSQNVAPVTAAPATQPSGHDFNALVDRLVDARDAAVPQAVRAAVKHDDFGEVSLRFDQNANGLSVSMSSADPDFARAVQASAASANPQGASDQGANASRQDAQGQQQQYTGTFSGQPQAQSQSQSQAQSQAFARDERSNQGQAPNRSGGNAGQGQQPDDDAADARGGIYA